MHGNMLVFCLFELGWGDGVEFGYCFLECVGFNHELESEGTYGQCDPEAK
jgi:hypothetical protein